MRRLLILCCILIAHAAGQSFEVATIKPADPSALPNIPLPDEARFRVGAEQIDYRGVTLKMMLQRAYEVNPAQISGPSWLDDTRYDVVAKFPAGATKDDTPRMLQQLLTERFHVVLHRERKRMNIYDVTIAKDGFKLKPAEPGQRKERESSDRMLARVAAGTMPDAGREHQGSIGGFLRSMSSDFDRPLRDSTGLTGDYDFQIEWFNSSRGPFIFAAFEEQLGLKVQPANEEMDYLVIDSASRTPDAN